MTPAISVLLDVLRFLLALVVAGGHLTERTFQDGWPDLRRFSIIAVGGFFVVSGYTIGLVTSRLRSPDSIRLYFADRAARLLSIVAPALALTAVCDGLAYWLKPEWYLAAWGQHASFPLARIALNLVLLSQPYGQDISPFSNTPFWSLSYEAGFYVLWGLHLLSQHATRVRWALLIAAVIYGPHILLMFPFWWLGVVLFRVVTRPRSVAAAYRVSAGFTVAMFAAAALLATQGETIVRLSHVAIDGLFGALHLPRGRVALSYMLGALVLGLALAAALPVLHALRDRLAPSDRTVAFFRRLGDATFPLYAMHFPIYVAVSALGVIDRSSPVQKLLLLSSVVAFSWWVVAPTHLLKTWLRTRLRRYAVR